MLVAYHLSDWVDIAISVAVVLDPSPKIQYHEIVLHCCDSDVLVLDFSVQIRATKEQDEQSFLMLLLEALHLLVLLVH
jgi:hypothetical protein